MTLDMNICTKNLHVVHRCYIMMLYHSVGNYGVCLQIGCGTQNFAPRPKDSGLEPSETINPVPGWANRHKQSLAMLGNAWHIPHKGCISFNESSQIWSNSQWWDLWICMTTLLRGSQTRTYSCKSWAPRGVPGEMFPWQDEVQPSAAVQGEKSRTFWMSWGLGICWIWTQGT